MTLDEAIQHCEEVAEVKLQDAELSEIQGCYNNAEKCVQCASDHKQLAEWLKELKKYKEKDTPRLVVYIGDGYADGYMVYDFANCPNCDYGFEYGDDNWNSPYCCRCGQRLEWESEVPE